MSTTPDKAMQKVCEKSASIIRYKVSVINYCSLCDCETETDRSNGRDVKSIASVDRLEAPGSSNRGWLA